MGKIILNEIEVMARIGLLEEEQYAPQDLRVSLELSYNFENIRETDDISLGIDYCDVVKAVREFCASYDGKTLERFAHLLSLELKHAFSLDHLKLTVDKPRYTKKLGLREIRVEVEH